jgi:hypothetical protein
MEVVFVGFAIIESTYSKTPAEGIVDVSEANPQSMPDNAFRCQQTWLMSVATLPAVLTVRQS